MKILVTGGAGFIGLEVIKLLTRHHEVVVLDSFEPKVHQGKKDTLIPHVAQVITGRVDDFTSMLYAMQKCEAIVHLAAGVSVEASYGEPARFFRTNSLGTAMMWQAIHRVPEVKHVVVASSMSVYGEGSSDRGVREEDPCVPQSFYGWSKYDTEQISVLGSRLYGIPVTALRIWNTYGPGQSLNNAETGVIAIFAARLLAGQTPVIYDSGNQLRDFVHVSDVARCFEIAINRRVAGVLNVGTGSPISVHSAASLLCEVLSDGTITPRITGTHRPGDVMDCFPDIGRVHRTLGWEAQIPWQAGLKEYAHYLRTCALQA
jgi:dTDP-L-rhamnose 4-epimerase